MSLHLVFQVACSLVFGFFFEVVVAAYTVHLTRGSLWKAAAFSGMTPFMALFAQDAFVEAGSLGERIALTAGTAIGYALGTLAVMRWERLR